MLRVRREDAVEAHQVHPRWRHQDSEFPHQLFSRHDELTAPTDGALHPVPIHIVGITGEPAQCEWAARTVSAKTLDAFAVVCVQAYPAVEREALEECFIPTSSSLKGSSRRFAGRCGPDLV